MLLAGAFLGGAWFGRRGLVLGPVIGALLGLYGADLLVHNAGVKRQQQLVKTLPDVLGREEVERFLRHVGSLKYLALFLCAYGAGLRPRGTYLFPSRQFASRIDTGTSRLTALGPGASG